MQVEASAPEWAACPPPISSQRKCKECTATGGLPRPGQGTRWEVSGLRVRMNAEEGGPGGPAECQNPSRLQLGGVRLGSPGHGMQRRVPPCAQARLALGRSDWACLPAPGRGDLEEGAAACSQAAGAPASVGGRHARTARPTLGADVWTVAASCPLTSRQHSALPAPASSPRPPQSRSFLVVLLSVRLLLSPPNERILLPVAVACRGVLEARLEGFSLCGSSFLPGWPRPFSRPGSPPPRSQEFSALVTRSWAVLL